MAYTVPVRYGKGMPVDLSEFLDDPKPCKVARLIAALNEVDVERHDRLVEAFAAKDHGEYRVSVLRLMSTMKDWGYTVSFETIRRHRVQACTCGS